MKRCGMCKTQISKFGANICNICKRIKMTTGTPEREKRDKLRRKDPIANSEIVKQRILDRGGTWFGKGGD